MKPSLLPRLLLSACLLAFLAGCNPPKPWEGVTAEQFARLNEHRLRGTALLENDQKDPAAAEFAAMQKERPSLADGYINQAACYAMQPERSAAALPTIKKGIELLPNAAWPYLVESALLRNTGDAEKATQSLENALKKEPRNLRVLGSMIRQLRDLPGDHGARLYDLRKTLVELTANNLVAQVEWLQSQVEHGDKADAAATVDKIKALLPRLSPDVRDFMERSHKSLSAGGDAGNEVRSLVNVLRGNPLYQVAQNEIFGAAQDPAALLMREWGTPPPALAAPALKPASITWKDVTADAGLASITVHGIAPVSVGDLNLAPDAGERAGDSFKPLQRVSDLLLGASTDTPAHSNGGRYTGGAGAAPGSPVLADFNNDYTLDAYVAAPEGDFVWRNPLQGHTKTEKLTFTRAASPLPPVRTPGRGAGSATVLDVDLDGDLDVVRASADPAEPAVRYLRNNGNFTFTDMTAASGLKIPSQGARQVVYGDFDGDNDPDLFVVRENGPCQLFLNLRQDAFRNATTEWKVKPDAGALSATVADFDRDGHWDVAVVGKAPHGSVLYRGTGSSFGAQPLPIPDGFDPEWIDSLDYDNDGWLDLVVAGKGGVLLLHNDHGKLSVGDTVLKDACRWVTWVDYDQDGDQDLLAVTKDDHVRLIANDGGNARPWIRLELQGYLVDPKNVGPEQQTQGNNSYGVGAVAEPRTVWDDQPVLMTRPVMQLGLGPAEKAVAVRVTWTHGVPQDAIAPGASDTLHFAQKPTGSCPYLYAWDGQQWRFVKDFNWRSPLGMLQARGKPVPHDLTQDWEKIPGEVLQPIGGYLRLNATEELREISYFDQIQLQAVDHPEGTAVYLDERFPFGPPQNFQIYTTRQERTPVSARDANGKDLLPALKAEDNTFTPVPPGPLRGVCAPHDLILDLGQVPDPKNVRLFLTGWIYPQPNSSNINASQNPDIRMIPPTLSVGDGHGGWTREDHTVGLPCGKRKTIVLDLSGKLTPGDNRVKFTTTCEIRWDRAFFTSGDAPVEVRSHPIPLADAELAEHGVGETYREVADGPDLRHYDNARTPEWRPITGAYTRLGECSPLLKDVDDRYAIIAPGDEMRMVFDGRALPALPAGWKRDYIIRTDGWTKDTDGNTVSGETVAPLPFHGMKRYPYGPDEHFPDTPAHRQWIREWNTRRMGASPGRQVLR